MTHWGTGNRGASEIIEKAQVRGHTKEAYGYTATPAPHTPTEHGFSIKQLLMLLFTITYIATAPFTFYFYICNVATIQDIRDVEPILAQCRRR